MPGAARHVGAGTEASTSLKPNKRLLDDFVTFARVEQEANDIEPWASLLAELWRAESLPKEEVVWLTTLYNTYDSLASAWGVYERWPTPGAWYMHQDRYDACSHQLYPRMTERRNLHGEAVLKRHESYCNLLMQRRGSSQLTWMLEPLEFDDPGVDFTNLTAHMRQVWGVGRQAAFEWAEFAGKVFGLPVDAADGQLWESSGPRKSLEIMYGLDNPTPATLDFVAQECMEMLADEGIKVPWVDLETLVCDFKVMYYSGRYYPGQHLAALKEEIAGIPVLQDCWSRVIPEPWASIEPGIDQAKRGVYRQTGEVITQP